MKKTTPILLFFFFCATVTAQQGQSLRQFIEAGNFELKDLPVLDDVVDTLQVLLSEYSKTKGEHYLTIAVFYGNLIIGGRGDKKFLNRGFYEEVVAYEEFDSLMKPGSKYVFKNEKLKLAWKLLKSNATQHLIRFYLKEKDYNQAIKHVRYFKEKARYPHWCGNGAMEDDIEMQCYLIECFSELNQRDSLMKYAADGLSSIALWEATTEPDRMYPGYGADRVEMILLKIKEAFTKEEIEQGLEKAASQIKCDFENISVKSVTTEFLGTRILVMPFKRFRDLGLETEEQGDEYYRQKFKNGYLYQYFIN